MDNNLFDRSSEIGVAHKISKKQYPRAVEVVSEISPSLEDQNIFSYPFYRLVFCTSGRAEFTVIKKKRRVLIELPEGHAMVIKPGAFIKSINQKPYETCGILLREQSLDYFTNDHIYRHRHRFMLPIRNVRNELCILFEQCLNFSHNNILLEQYVRLIWTHIEEMIKSQKHSKGSHVTFMKAKAYVKKHFQHGINRKISSKELGLNQDYLNSLFHKFSGLNFTQYLLQVKLEKANELLHDKELSISQVSKLSGFNSNTYFGRQFKKHYKMTPLNYRKTLNQA